MSNNKEVYILYSESDDEYLRGIQSVWETKELADKALKCHVGGMFSPKTSIRVYDVLTKDDLQEYKEENE